jgi:ATP-dependent protease HslVU (ClpYQ) ATPase subunit
MDQNQSPEQIYTELSRFIIGQTQAKRTMAVALRNRWRKQQLTKIEQAIIRPHHVLMVGPSGSGKTAIGKQLAKLSHSPFVKAEATQFTEVGYIGREVSEIVEDLVTEALNVLRTNADQGSPDSRVRSVTMDNAPGAFDGRMADGFKEMMAAHYARRAKAEEMAKPKIKESYEKLADLLEFNAAMSELHHAVMRNQIEEFDFSEPTETERKQMLAQLETTALDKREIYVPKIHRKPLGDGFRVALERMMKGCLGGIVKLGTQGDATGKPVDVEKFRAVAIEAQRFLTTQRQIKVGRLKNLWQESLLEDSIHMLPPLVGPTLVSSGDFAEAFEDPPKEAEVAPSKVSKLSTRPPSFPNAVAYAQQHGIIFIDEIDKLIGKGTERSDATRAGVQRDLLPLLDGCMVKTGKYGIVDTSNMLFICSGAFQLHKPEDLMVELQGRLPIRVLLEALSVEDFINILRLKEENILDQYVNMMRVDGVDLVIEDEAVVAIAKAAFSLNLNQGNYGARRLYACVEHALADVTFLSAPRERIKITITKEYVENHLGKH